MRFNKSYKNISEICQPYIIKYQILMSLQKQNMYTFQSHIGKILKTEILFLWGLCCSSFVVFRVVFFGFACNRPVSCILNFASVSGVSILE